MCQDSEAAGTFNCISAERLCKAIEQASDGRMVIKFYPAGGIVPTDTELDGIMTGVLDMATSTAPIIYTSKFPQASLFSYIVGGPTAMQYFLWYRVGPGFELMQEMHALANVHNVKPVAAMGLVPETFLYTTFPIEKLEDLVGKKCRLLGDEAAIFGELGVKGVATPSPEVYEAVSRGVLDGFQHSNLFVDWTYGLQEVVDYAYVSPVRQPTDAQYYAANMDSWAALPDSLKKLVEELCWAEGLRYFAETSLECTTATPKWIDYGVVVDPAPKELEDRLTEIATAYYIERGAEDPFFAKVVESLISWRDSWTATYPRL